MDYEQLRTCLVVANRELSRHRLITVVHHKCVPT